MKASPLRKRIRAYEDSYRIKLPRRTPMIIRVDGRAFHTLTKGLQKPWDYTFALGMDQAARELLKQVSGARIAYVQSDEITVLVIDYNLYETQPWFGKGLQKIVSVSASIATMAFNNWMSYYTDSPIEHMKMYADKAIATFDSRAFVVPREEVCNVFIDRQQDCIRNSILGLGQHLLGKKRINGMSCEDIKAELQRQKLDTWEKQEDYWKFGRTFFKENDCGEQLTISCPIFSEDRIFIDKYVWPKNEEGKYSSAVTLGKQKL